MTFDQIINSIKENDLKPVYLLTGEESYFIDMITSQFAENILTDEQKAFNFTVFYGKDTDAVSVINAARRFPMMSDYQLIIIKEAQNLRNIEELIHYTNSPLKSTILVINYKYKKLDKRKKLYHSIEKHGVIFESKKLYEDKIPDWIINYLHKKGYGINPASSVLLTEYLGNDLSKIVNELNKLIVGLNGQEKNITTDHIEKNIGISKEYNNLELQNALINNDVVKAARIVNYFAKNQKNNPVNLTISSLYYFFNKVLLVNFTADKSKAGLAVALKVNPYFVPEYQKAARLYPPERTISVISLLREYDLKSKGIGNITATPGDLLNELIYKIMHVS